MRLIILPLLLACGPKNNANDNAEEDVAGNLTERTTTDGLVEQQIDLNGDGTADVFNYYQEHSEGTRLLVRKEVDLNWDSRVDVRSWFDLSGQLEKEEMERQKAAIEKQKADKEASSAAKAFELKKAKEE